MKEGLRHLRVQSPSVDLKHDAEFTLFLIDLGNSSNPSQPRVTLYKDEGSFCLLSNSAGQKAYVM